MIAIWGMKEGLKVVPMNKPQYRIKLVSWDEVSAYFDPNLIHTPSLAF
jgi:hypothetical protein